MIKNVYLSHTAAHVVLFPLLVRVPWYQAPWPTSTQDFSDPIRLLFRRGGERAESKFSYTVAVIFVSIQALITQLSSTYHSTFKFSTSLGYTSTWSRTPLRGIIYTTSTTPMKLASPATIDTEARRSTQKNSKPPATGQGCCRIKNTRNIQDPMRVRYGLHWTEWSVHWPTH